MTRRLLVATLAALLVVGAARMSAHPMTIKGVVVAVDRNGVQVAAIDDKDQKSPKPEWHTIGPKVKILRAGKRMTFVAAKIAVDERVVLLVDHGSDGKMTVVEMRLAAR